MDTNIGILKDKLGRPVDESIKESVLSFNRAGFVTTQSCEGHLDHAYPAPYIDVIETADIGRLKALVASFNRENFLPAHLRIKVHAGFMYSPTNKSRIARVSTLTERQLDSHLEGKKLDLGGAYLEASQEVMSAFSDFLDREGL